MTSYNYISGTYASESKDLVTTVLRDEWGYEGTVMTDWFGGKDGAKQMWAGNDMLQPGKNEQFDSIVAGVKSGKLDVADLDRNVKRVLNLVEKSPRFQGYQYSNKPDLKAHAQLVRENGSCGTVLLENKDNVLPLAANAKIAAFGNASYDTYVGGTGSGNVNRAYKVNINEGLKNAGFTLVEDLEKAYTAYITAAKSKQAAESFWATPFVEDLNLSAAQIKAAIDKADVAIYTISRQAGEGADRKLEKGDYYLTDVEATNLKNISEAAHAAGKKLVVLLNMGSIIQLTEQVPLVDGLVHVFMPGQEAGNSIADVLCGKVNPSGKLPMTWAKAYKDYPSAVDFPLSPGEDRVVKYTEDIFVGYRHFDKNKVEPLYPFGFGKSYTTFEYANLAVKANGDTYTVTVDVKNTGKVAGREVVQLYVTAPKGTLEKPVKELKAFGKSALVQPGQTATVTMTFKKADLASYDEAKKQWVVDPGTYTLNAAASAADLRLNTTINL
jgi:beta-glucosidase